MTYEIEHLHQPHGWLSPGFVTVTDGRIATVDTRPAAGVPVERCRGYGVPGLTNLHSHAFQRALAGRTEWVADARVSDDLWTWREAMYRLVDHLDPEHYEALAAFTYVQLLKGGFTGVCEFHYLHHSAGGARFSDPAEMAIRLFAAASTAGIALTLLPTLYLHGGIGKPVTATQLRFAHASVLEYLTLVDHLHRRVASAAPICIGAALHSLRAVSPNELTDTVAGVTAIDPSMRIHIHVSETVREVEEVQAGLGARPVEWLLNNTTLDERWTLVHATHVDANEIAGLARSNAVAGLCPLTEATLGDGVFPLVAFQSLGGRWGIGTDSHYTARAASELRTLECGQRLAVQRRNTLSDPATTDMSHCGRRLFDLALAGGAQASGRGSATLSPGESADLVILDADSPTLLAHDPATTLDAWLLGGDDNSVRDVMVGGRWVIRGGRHEHDDEISKRFVAAVDAGVRL